jgi:peptidoglycan/xylan/chitin deacetylase (PgdA/CDA1 family)
VSPGRRRLLRPPFGKLNLASLIYALVTRRRIVLWNVDPRDYQETSPERIAERVVMRAQPGAVVLLHDGRAPGKDAGTNVTAEALRLILSAPGVEGLRTATAGEALRCPAETARVP